MRYHYEKPLHWRRIHGITHRVRHPLFDRCTVFREKRVGFAVIQQRFDPETKRTYWTEIDPWLCDEIFESPEYEYFFHKNARLPDENECYPTFPIRMVMHAMKLKPMKRERWETGFERKVV